MKLIFQTPQVHMCDLEILCNEITNIQSRRENKGIAAELLRLYPKNANLPNPSENIQLPPYRKKIYISTTDDMDGSLRLKGRSEQANRHKPCRW
jgi:hypothetical protein